MLMPPYSALFRILGGTNRPNDTATMRLIDSPSGFGNYVQVRIITRKPRNFFFTHIPSRKRISLMNIQSKFKRNSFQRRYTKSDPSNTTQKQVQVNNSRSLISFNPLPALFPGRTITSIDGIPSGSLCCSSCSARREATLKRSEPQNKIRKGLETEVGMSPHSFWLVVNRNREGQREGPKPMGLGDFAMCRRVLKNILEEKMVFLVLVLH